MKSFLRTSFSALLAAFLLAACVTTQETSSTEPLNTTGTPSPLNTSANPWTNVNPQIQGQYQAQRQRP